MTWRWASSVNGLKLRSNLRASPKHLSFLSSTKLGTLGPRGKSDAPPVRKACKQGLHPHEIPAGQLMDGQENSK